MLGYRIGRARLAGCDRPPQKYQKNRWNFSIGFLYEEAEKACASRIEVSRLKRDSSGLSRDRKLCLIY